MAELLVAESFGIFNIAEQSQLTVDALANQANLTIANNITFATDNLLVIGHRGSEQSEIRKISSINNQIITLSSNLALKHYSNEPIYRIRYDAIKFYRAVNVNGSAPIGASFTSLSTVGIEADQLFTNYIDDLGGSGYWYKYTYFNTVFSNESALSDAIAVRGGGYGMYASVDEVRQEAGFQNNRWITDQTIESKLSAAQSEVNSVLAGAGYLTPLADIPNDIKHAVILLAAGYLLTMEYGPENNGLTKDGTLKIKQAYDILKAYTSSEKVIIDEAGAISGRGSRVSGYPNDSTNDINSSENRFFSITDRF